MEYFGFKCRLLSAQIWLLFVTVFRFAVSHVVMLRGQNGGSISTRVSRSYLRSESILQNGASVCTHALAVPLVVIALIFSL